jgi:hypothetical protein
MPRIPNIYKDAQWQRRLWTPNPAETAFWVEANDLSTVIVGTGGVSQWNDKSSGGRNVSQSNSSKRPSYDFVRKAVKFTAANSNILISSDFINTTGPFSVSILTTENGSVQTQEPFYNGDSGLSGWGFLNNWISDQNKFQGLYGGVAVLQASAPRVVGRPISQTLIRIGTGNNTFFVDGVGYSIGTNNPATPTRGLTLGAGYATFPAISGYYDGYMHSVVVATKAWSTYERQRIEGYQYWAYGAQQYLPATHPFRNRPPLIGD